MHGQRCLLLHVDGDGCGAGKEEDLLVRKEGTVATDEFYRPFLSLHDLLRTLRRLDPGPRAAAGDLLGDRHRGRDLI